MSQINQSHMDLMQFCMKIGVYDEVQRIKQILPNLKKWELDSFNVDARKAADEYLNYFWASGVTSTTMFNIRAMQVLEVSTLMSIVRKMNQESEQHLEFAEWMDALSWATAIFTLFSTLHSHQVAVPSAVIRAFKIHTTNCFKLYMEKS